MENIDFVITWVDGGDPAWQAEKRRYQPQKNDDDSAVRYRDWDNLQYWFRAVEQYAPWVNRIHFITWGHLPGWLNTQHPKLHIVNHADYIPPQYLPVFSSHPIELNIHRIRELAEHFVYFNDDIFLNAPVTPRNFFKNGKPVDKLIFDVLYPSQAPISPILYNNCRAASKYIRKPALIKNNLRKIFYPWYGVAGIKNYLTLPYPWFTGFYNHHLPISFRKSDFEEVWAQEPELMDSTCRNRFRSGDDVSPWLIRYWYLAKGEVEPCSYRQGKIFELSDDNRALLRELKRKKYRMICCNDAGRCSDFEKVKAELSGALHDELPDKSRFEV